MRPAPQDEPRVWIANSTQYLSDEQLTRAIEEFRRVVRPGGLVAVKEVDILVWQYQPQDPKLMWRLLDAQSDDTHISGAMRGTRLSARFRAAGLENVSAITTLAERRHYCGLWSANTSATISHLRPGTLTRTGVSWANAVMAKCWRQPVG